MLGLFNINKLDWEKSKKKLVNISENFILEKIKERTKAKKEENFELADKIRNELLNNGIIIEDEKNKTNWKYK